MAIKMCGIDASSKKTGMAFLNNGKLVHCGLLDFSSYTNREERMALMCNAILDKLDEQKPNILYIEDSWNAANVETTKLLTRILGVTYAWALKNNCEWNSILPSTWRKYCGIEQGKKKRAELKQASIDYVKQRYKIDVNDDVADAIALSDGVVNYFKLM